MNDTNAAVPHTAVTVSELPDCDFHPHVPAAYDAATTMGRWAHLCPACFTAYGIGLGLGRGQRLLLACLDADAKCSGTVEFRHALSPTGKAYPRCEFHWNARLAVQERIDNRYPDSPVPPAGFDPSIAGESWDEGQ